jgi:hypothetical protein
MPKLTNKIIKTIFQLKYSGLRQREIAEKFNISQPMVSYILAGKYTIRKSPNLKESFWQRVEKHDKQACWIWCGGFSGWGYGIFKFRGVKYSAHRIAAKLAGQKIQGKIVRHTCDNPACVNPNHLLTGTHADNVADKVKRNRQSKGVNNGRAKLTEKQVKFIRKSKLSNCQLGKKFNISPRAILAIRKLETWRYLV